MINFDSVSKQKIVMVQRTVIYKYVEVKERSLGNTREHFRRRRINTVDLDGRITRQPTDITIGESVGTELI
jgi:hypothetical protein